MTNISLLIKKNQLRWDNMVITPARVPGLTHVAQRLVTPEAKLRYKKIEQTTHVPWFVIAVMHERESSQNFACQLAQGDPLSRVSTHDPQGRGPFFNHPNDPPGEDAFYRGALDALIDCPPHASKWTDWSPGGTMTLLESYNGYGYANMGVPSAYIWSGSNMYVSGKYIADHVYRSNVVDTQEGCAPIIKIMSQLDPDVNFGSHPTQIIHVSEIIVPDVVETEPTPSKETPQMINWKTTLAGITAIFTAVGALFSMGKIDWSMIGNTLPAILAGIGLIFAKDSNVTGVGATAVAK